MPYDEADRYDFLFSHSAQVHSDQQERPNGLAGMHDARAYFRKMGIENPPSLPPGMDVSCIFRQDLQGVEAIIYLKPGSPFHGFLWWNQLVTEGYALKTVRWASFQPSVVEQKKLLAEYADDQTLAAPPYIWSSQGHNGATWVYIRVAMSCLMQCGSEAVKCALNDVSGPTFLPRNFADICFYTTASSDSACPSPFLLSVII